MASRANRTLALFLGLLGIAAFGSFVPMLDAFAHANREGGMLLVVSVMILLTGLGCLLIGLAWRMLRR